MSILGAFVDFWSPIFYIMGFILFVYYAFYIIAPWFMDCDFQLTFVDLFGMNISSLKGKNVWITGASSGIGEHLAYVLAKAGCNLVLTARRESELKRVRSNCLLINSDVRTLVLPLDVCDFSRHQKAVDQVINELGPLDILVNNAGRSQRANWEKINVQVDRDMFELNVLSALSLTRLVMPRFRGAEHGFNLGHVVVMSSCAGLFGIPYSASYVGSKHSLHGYFESLRTEQMESNFAVTLVCPGPVQTNFLQEAFTGNPNEKFNEPTPVARSKMSVQRCAYLTAVAIANKLPEVWICNPKCLQLVYLNKYYPNLARFIMKRLGNSFIQNLRDNKQTVQNNTT